MVLHRWDLPLLLAMGMAASAALAQNIQPRAAGPIQPQEAFVENAPLAEARLDESIYNAREQNLREHYLPTPIGDLPEGRNLQEAAQAMPAPTQIPEAEAATVQIVQNRPLADGEINNGTSIVTEPSVAVRGNEILMTGNWFATFSRDGGATFQFRNPFLIFPTIPNRGFCCDQVAHYFPSHDLMVWFLQHLKDSTGNTVRLAVAHGDDIGDERWRYYDFTPQQVGNWTGEWFDYPDISASNQFLFITTNSFNMSNQFQRAVTLRLPLEELKNYAALNYLFFDVTNVGSLRPVQGARDVMHIGTHLNTGTLRVFVWPDAGGNIQFKDFAVDAWVRGGASCPGPDGNDWLGFVDGRITAAWASGARHGFAWTSAQGGSFPQPNVRAAIIDWNAGNVTSQPHIWNGGIAFAYPAAAANASGQIGISLAYGGGSLHPSHAVGVLDSGSAWSLVASVNGTNGPDTNRWGDYLTVRVNGANQNRFATTGYSLSQGTNNEDIVPRVVQFDAQFTTPSPTPPFQRAPVTIAQAPSPDAAARRTIEPAPAVNAPELASAAPRDRDSVPAGPERAARAVIDRAHAAPTDDQLADDASPAAPTVADVDRDDEATGDWKAALAAADQRRAEVSVLTTVREATVDARSAEPDAAESDAPSESAEVEDSNERNRKFSWSAGAARARPTNEVFELVAAASTRMGLAEVSDAGTTVINIEDDEDVDEYQDLLELPPAAIFFFDPPESVCTPDERTQVTDTTVPPWSSNCQLIITFQNGARAVGSGWLLGSRLVVTAGHCVHEGEGGNFFRSVEVIPGMNGMDRPFGSQISSDLRASEQWKTNGLQAADYGAILLPAEFQNVSGESPGTVDAAVLNDSELSAVNVLISGYPADKPTGTQWSHSGPLGSIIPNRLFYTIDTAGGHSGSKVTFVRDGTVQVVGIHNYGGCPNKGTRINSNVMADLQAWLAENTSP